MDHISYDRFNDNTPIVVDGQMTYGLWQPPSFLENIDQIPQEQILSFSVDSSTENDPGAIAQEVYGSEFLDWVLFAFNNVINTTDWPKAGTVVLYPDRALIAKYIT